jgi:hypothetical protein
MEACLLRGERQLCEIANEHSMLHPPADFTFPQRIEFFRVADTKRLRNVDLTTYEMAGTGLRQAGDIQIDLEHLIMHWAKEPKPREEKALNTYVVRRVGTQWRIVARINCAAETDDVSLCPGWVPPEE